MIKRLRRKFILIAMLSLFCVLAIIMITVNALSYRKVISKADKTLDFIAYNGGMFPIPGAPTKPVAPGESIPYEEIYYDSRFFSATFTAKGELVAIFTDDVNLDKETAEGLARYVIGFRDDRAFLGNYRYFVNRGESFCMVMFLDCTAALSAAKTFLFLSLLISAIGMVAVFALILVASKIIIKPISENAEKQKRFITDAGHELKTPLTIIDADAELIEMENGRSEWVDDIRQQTKRLAALTNDLIYLSRMEEEAYTVPRIEFPISDMVTERAGSFMSRFKTDGKTLNIRVERMLTYNGDEKAISQLVSLLLDNALKYSSKGGAVEIGLRKQPKNLVLYVANSVDHITKEETDRFFDRFWRGDKSRSSKGGYGLGLSCAQAIVTAHKGKISAAPLNKKTVQITAVLPL